MTKKNTVGAKHTPRMALGVASGAGAKAFLTDPTGRRG